MKSILFLLLSFATGVSFAQPRPDTLAVKEDFKDDWAALSKYAAENRQLGDPQKGEKRVVFLGSSIFENWKKMVPSFFEGHPYINRGISGQISPQLLIRFRQDVIALKPKAVIILAGSNDIAGSTGHVTNDRIMDNIRSMVELAKANEIVPILCAYLPVYDYPWRAGLKPAEKIISLNKLIAAYARSEKLVLIDYFTPLADARNGQKAELTLDGVHPNAAGYALMAIETEKAIKRVMSR